MKVKGGLKVFWMDWKRKILIVSFLNCIQEKKVWKAGRKAGKVGGFVVHNCLCLTGLQLSLEGVWNEPWWKISDIMLHYAIILDLKV